MNEKINLQELAALFSARQNITKKEADGFLRELFSVMSEGLLADGTLKVKDLGTFKIIDVEARESINVRTGERVTIAAHRKLSYTADKALTERLNASSATAPTPVPEQSAQPPAPRRPSASTVPLQPVHPSSAPTDRLPEPLPAAVPATELTKKEIDAFFATIPALPPDAESASCGNYAADRTKPLTFHMRYPVVTSLAVVALSALTLYGLFYFITSSNKKEYRSTLRRFYAEKPAAVPQPDAEGNVRYNDLPPMPTDTATDADAGHDLQRTTLKRGEKLSDVALREYNNPVFWVYLYEANRNIVGHPDSIAPGTEIIVPDADVYNLNNNNLSAIRKAIEMAERITEELRTKN
jgi:nucleoid DNA-binding protein